MPGELKPTGIADPFLQARNIVHIHIKNPAAFRTLHMIMLIPPVIKAVWPAWSLNFADLSCFRQPVQIPIHCGFADGGVLFYDLVIDLVRGSVTLQFVHCVIDQRALNRVALYDIASVLNDIYILLI